MSVEIKEVKTKKDLLKFIRFNLDLYKGNPFNVPGLVSDELKTLSKDKNPSFECCEAVYFLAYRNNKIAGRIAGIIVHKSNEIWKQKHARFGYVDFIDDREVSAALFDAVGKWAKDKGMDHLHGPLGFTDFDYEGMLVEGFDQLGTMSTIYNYPYYAGHLEDLGFRKDHDWKEYKIYIPDSMPEKHRRIAELVQQRYGLKILKFKKRKEIWPYARNIFETLNEAYKPLYGFTPLTDSQIDYYIKIYFPMLRLDLITLVIREADNKVVGFGLSLPSLSEAMQKANGSLFPTGFVHLLKALYSKPKIIDLYLISILPEYQNKGVNALIFNDLIPVFIKYGTVYAESNPELETNNAVQSQWSYFKTEHHKTRRAFIKQI